MDESDDSDDYEYASRSNGLPPPPREPQMLDTKGPVFCHSCKKSQVIDTLVCLRKDTWPICCGKPMDPENLRKHALRRSY